MVCIGYIGTEVFDIVLYTGHTLTKLKYPVLIVDLSGTGALKNAIHHGMDIDSEKEIVHYRNINYIRRIPDEYELKEFKDGVVFVLFGFNYMDIAPIRLDYMNIVVNPFSHVLEKINVLIRDRLLQNMNFRLLVRDIVSFDDLEKVKISIMLPDKQDDIEYLYLDFNDYENAIRCQRYQTVKYRRISFRMKKYIVNEIKYIVSILNMEKTVYASYSGKGQASDE